MLSPSFKHLQEISDASGVDAVALLTNPSSLPPEDQRRMSFTRIDDDRYVACDSFPARELLEKANGVCELCDAKMPVPQVFSGHLLEAHFIECLSRGRRNTADIIVVLCPSCHKGIHMLLYEEAVSILKKRTRRR